MSEPSTNPTNEFDEFDTLLGEIDEVCSRGNDRRETVKREISVVSTREGATQTLTLEDGSKLAQIAAALQWKTLNTYEQDKSYLSLFVSQPQSPWLLQIQVSGQENLCLAVVWSNAQGKITFSFLNEEGNLVEADLPEDFRMLHLAELSENLDLELSPVLSQFLVKIQETIVHTEREKFSANRTEPIFEELEVLFTDLKTTCFRVCIDGVVEGVIFFIGEGDDRVIYFKPDGKDEEPLNFLKVQEINLRFPQVSDELWVQERLSIPAEVELEKTTPLPTPDVEDSTDTTGEEAASVQPIERHETRILGSDTITNQVKPIEGLIQRPITKKGLLNFIKANDEMVIVEFLRNNKPTYGLLRFTQKEGTVKFEVLFKGEGGDSLQKQLIFEEILRVAPLKGNEDAIISLR